MNPRPFRIVPTQEWGARPPRTGILPVTRKPVRALFHHTAGHYSELGGAGESYHESVGYAHAIQNFHMEVRGWIDSGHNFLVTRSGYIFEGRHGSFARVSKGQMIVSAHCPGQNEQPGVEIEHAGGEPMTAIQREAAVWLFAWICRSCTIQPNQIKGHKDFFATECPGALYAGLPAFRFDVGKLLKPRKRHYYQIQETDEYGMTVVKTQSQRTYVLGPHVVSAKIQRN